jgi:hypothetical protein
MALGIYEEEDIRALAEEIRVWGQTDKTYTVKQMVQGVNDVASAAHSDGYVGGHTAGFEEGKAIGYKEGQRDGYELGRADGITEGFYEGEAVGYQNGITEGIEQGKTEAYAEVEPINTQLENTLNGTDTGGKSYYDEFWDNFQNYGQRDDYNSAFTQSSYEYIRPKHKIAPTEAGGANNTFLYARKLKKIEAEYFDFSQMAYGTYAGASFNYTFCSCDALKEVEDIGLPPTWGYTYTFSWSYSIHTIAKITVDENTRFDNTFQGCLGLINLTMAGTIGQNGFNVQWSTKLSKASIISIINALSTTTSGLSVTLSKTAVETAFGSTESEEWIALINTRSNWTINLV